MSTKNDSGNGISKAANVIMSAQEGTYYAAIRDLAYLVLDELPDDRRAADSLQWGFFFALARMVRTNLTGLALDVNLTHDITASVKVTNRVLELCAKNRDVK